MGDVRESFLLGIHSDRMETILSRYICKKGKS